MDPAQVDKVETAVDVRQWIKWVVYCLLLVNFGFYIGDDWEIASHTMRNGGSFLDWTGSFAAIEMNVVDWRGEMEATEAQANTG